MTVYNGQLFISYANGTVAQFSANAGDAYDNFVPSTTPGGVTTTFSLSQSGTLLWNSASFFNGNALFCLLPSGTIVAVFQQGAQPTSCDFIDLTIVELAGCVIPAGSSATLIPPNPSGPTGPSGIQGQAGPSGPTGPLGPSGPSGPIGPSGAAGGVGATGPLGPSGPSGPIGMTGAAGATGATGVAGPSGPQGLQGVQGPSGAIGATGPQGSIGSSGPRGSSGASGPSGPTGATGLTGPSGAPGIAYAYLGCFFQAGTSSTPTVGKVLNNFIATYTTSGNVQCSTYCNSQNNNFYGVTNTGSSVDCYCGDTLQYVTIANLGAGMAPGNNCGTCYGGPAPAGECGVVTSFTVAIYARAY